MVFLCQVFICDYLCVLRPFLFLFHVLFIDAGRPTAKPHILAIYMC